MNTCKCEHGCQEEEQFKIEAFTWLYRVLNALSTDILELGYEMNHILGSSLLEVMMSYQTAATA